MKVSLFNPSYTQEVIELFTQVFSASENESEGQLIGNLVSNLIATSKPEDLIGFIAISNEHIVGCIFFSRFIVPSNDLAFMLSPVAVATSEQGTGIGQRLISDGLEHLKSLKVNLAFTYGDPSYYSKTGFKPISESIIRAPFELSQPEGWLAQALDGNPIKAMQGSTKCIDALSNQEYW
jgi:putative acetyltransferase